MSRLVKIILAVIVSMFIITVLSAVIYKHTGWKEFTMKKGENFQITNADPTLVSKLRFTDCIVKYKGVNGEIKVFDVSSILTKMAAAYKGNTKKGFVFKLDDPGLSVYSFQVPGFNDKNNKPLAENWDDGIIGTNVTMTGYYKLIN